MSEHKPGGDAGDPTETTNNAQIREDILTDNGMLTPHHERTDAPTKLGVVPSSYGAAGGGDGVEPTDGEPVDGS